MEGCYYVGWFGWAFGWTQMIPIFVTLVCTVLTTATHQPLYFLFSFFLYIPQVALWCFQAYFEAEMPDPVCQVYQNWAFPSIPAFYVAVCISFFFVVSILWEFEHSWIIWFTLYTFGIVPPLLLVWFGYNRWWEVLLSLGYGAFCGIVFGFLMRYFIEPVMPYLQHHFPLYDFGYVDTICMDPRQKEETLHVRQTVAMYFRMD